MFSNKKNFQITLPNNFKPPFQYTSLTKELLSRNIHPHSTNISFDNVVPHKKMHNSTSTNTSLTKTYSSNFQLRTNIPHSSYKKNTNKNIILNKVNNLFTNISTFIPTSSIMENKSKKKHHTKITMHSYGHVKKNMDNGYGKRNVVQKDKKVSLSIGGSKCKVNKNGNDERGMVGKLKKEIMGWKEKNEVQAKFYEGVISKLNGELKEVKGKVVVLEKERKKIKKERDVMLKKEKKLMKMLYMLKKKGIDVEDLVSLGLNGKEDGVKMRRDGGNESKRSEMSLTEVKFVDKNKCGKSENTKEKVPKLDFNLVPGYESSEDEGIVYEIAKAKKDKFNYFHDDTYIKHNSSF